MDIFSIKPATQEVAIINPGDGREMGLVFEVTSAESDAVKRVRRRQLDKALRSNRRKMTADQIEDNAIELTAAAVAGWEWKGSASAGGKKLEFTPENVAMVLKIDWIRKQVQEVIDDEAGFFMT